MGFENDAATHDLYLRNALEIDIFGTVFRLRSEIPSHQQLMKNFKYKILKNVKSKVSQANSVTLNHGTFCSERTAKA